MHNVLGGTIDPHASYLLLRGMKTLDLRVQRQNATALELARRLEAHPLVQRVHYPGLPSHPDHAIATAQMTGFGGVISFEVDGDLWRTARFIDSVRLPYIAPSLGGVESLIEQPTVVRCARSGGQRRAGCTGAARQAGMAWQAGRRLEGDRQPALPCDLPGFGHSFSSVTPQSGGATMQAGLFVLPASYWCKRRVCPGCPPCSYWDQGPEKRAQVGIKDNLIRFSCGIESVEDIWADFEQAFDNI
jgi:cystathionine beta-lyase/cystathionine gamma-synthase